LTGKTYYHGRWRKYSHYSKANPINAYTMGTIIKGSGLTIEEFKKLL
jgi:hypothetical protein